MKPPRVKTSLGHTHGVVSENEHNFFYRVRYEYEVKPLVEALEKKGVKAIPVNGVGCWYVRVPKTEFCGNDYVRL